MHGKECPAPRPAFALLGGALGLALLLPTPLPAQVPTAPSRTPITASRTPVFMRSQRVGLAMIDAL